MRTTRLAAQRPRIRPPARRISHTPPPPPRDPTIYALSTARGRAAIAIVRCSGPASLAVYRALCPRAAAPAPRTAAPRALRDPRRPAATLDPRALVLFFPAPRSATGEDVLELHLHGGPAVVAAVLAAIPRAAAPGEIRHAEPGELTRRAFANGRLDLTQAEALADILSATTEQQRRVAVRGASATLARRYESWRAALLSARATLEALIDFSEEQHFESAPRALLASIATNIRALRTLLHTHTASAQRGEKLREGLRIALLGAPNAGKSSLLNRLVRRDAAIVSPDAGTTRDVLDLALDIAGYLCRVCDTAGLRADAPVSPVEREGMRRAHARARASDIVLAVLSVQRTSAGGARLAPCAQVLACVKALLRDGRPVLVAVNKADLLRPGSGEEEALARSVRDLLPGLGARGVGFISCLGEGEGVEGLLRDVAGLCYELTTSTGAADGADGADDDDDDAPESLSASARHRQLLETCMASLDSFLEAVGGDEDDDHEAELVLAAEHLRAAAESLARITGRGEAGDVEEVLGVVFARFCVGK